MNYNNYIFKTRETVIVYVLRDVLSKNFNEKLTLEMFSFINLYEYVINIE